MAWHGSLLWWEAGRMATKKEVGASITSISYELEVSRLAKEYLEQKPHTKSRRNKSESEKFSLTN